MRGREKFKRAVLFFHFFDFILKFVPKRLRIIIFNHIRNIQGIKGIAFRYMIFRSLAKKCGENVSIHPGVFFFKVENISIGDNVSIHPMCYIDATGNIKIGNDVSIAHGTTIMTTTHNYLNNFLPIKDQELQLKEVVIQDNVWIGAKVTVLAGITISNGVIIGANSVVTKDIMENEIVGGCPAKFIKFR